MLWTKPLAAPAVIVLVAIPVVMLALGRDLPAAEASDVPESPFRQRVRVSPLPEDLTWLNTADGTWTMGGTTSGGGRRELSSPLPRGDAVLWLRPSVSSGHVTD